MGNLVGLGVAVAVVLAAAGCEPATPEPASATPTITVSPGPGVPVVALLPVPTPLVPHDQCPVTRGADRTEPLPTSLPLGSAEHWYGAGPLWADLSLIIGLDRRPVGPDGRTYRVRWKAFVDGPLVARVTRLDGPAEPPAQARTFAAIAEGHEFWTGEIWLPTAGCWLVTATVDGISLGFVVRSW